MAASSTYHHGDLPNALKAATAELITEVGPTAFSLREVARRAGVSHAAPAHHFGDKHGLLRALGLEGFVLLAEALGDPAIRALEDPVDRLAAQGRAYVSVARRHPAHFAVMFRPDLGPEEDEVAEAGAAAFGELVTTIEEIRDRFAPDLDVMDAAMMCWTMVQGLVELGDALVDEVSETLSEVAGGKRVAGEEGLEALVDRMTRLAVRGMAPRA